LADRVHLTVVDAEPPGDTFMPALEGQWRETLVETFPADEKHRYGFRYAVLERSPA
jgi:dihydrofolate reductase